MLFGVGALFSFLALPMVLLSRLNTTLLMKNGLIFLLSLFLSSKTRGAM